MAPSDISELRTTSPRLFMLFAMLRTPAAPEGVRSCGVPSASQSTACGALGLPGTKGGRTTLEHSPDMPTAWPTSLLVKAKDTVSPGSGGRGVGIPLSDHLTASKRRT